MGFRGDFLPFCTRENKTEIGKIPKRKIKAEKLKHDHMKLGNVGKHQLHVSKKKDAKPKLM